MPTINQLVRKERQKPQYKSKAPALGKRSPYKNLLANCKQVFLFKVISCSGNSRK